MSKKEEKALMKINMEEDQSQGMENLTKDDLSIPFFKILQSNSPEVMEGDSRPGMIVNSASGEAFKEMEVIPCGYQKQFIEWTPRESGGGLKATYNSLDGLELMKTCTKDDKGKDILSNGNLLVPTAVHYVCSWLDGPILGIMSMTSTALKKSRKWNSTMSGIKVQGSKGMYTPPTFGHSYSIKTHQESNNYGTWFNWDITLKGEVDDENLYLLCKKFSNDMQQGLVKVEHNGKNDIPF